jgi:hypothetical protein
MHVEEMQDMKYDRKKYLEEIIKIYGGWINPPKKR